MGDADEVGAKLIFEKNINQWRHRANLDFGHEVGEKKRSGLSAGLAWGTYYNFDQFQLGGEYYADFGNLRDDLDYDEQEHHIGPVVGFDIPVAGREVETKIGYLAGVSNASNDHIIKYEFELEF